MGCGFAIECYAAAGFNGLLDWLASLLTFNTVLSVWVGAFIGAQFGWPGFIGLTLGLASFLQRKMAPSDTHEHVSGKDALPAVKPAKKKRRTIQDMFSGLGK